MLRAVDRVLRRLPENGLPRSQLAAETLGDAHA
ncbi:TIGR02679 domain-containing protein [Pseudomonas sp. NFACC44-2]